MLKVSEISILCGLICVFALASVVHCQTPAPDDGCAKLNDSCGTCIKNASCLWCNTDNTCKLYPVKHVIPQTTDCKLSAARWGVCWLNFEAMIISVSIIGGVLLIAITLCFCKCCGCCCFKKNNSKYLREEARLDRERQERQMRQDERRQDRQRKNDDIRRKYGLMGSNNQYQRFDDETA
uniref:Pituitary tumor-transforming gene 1 protein-interacting protein n=1 Tax=Phallusia mammillata TaxID=59560 RepID=A0A6F9DQB0_9ASCI|nr:pituitary tumor-transforming gene 1 protein-interacting protein [Phallusia mammillata]